MTPLKKLDRYILLKYLKTFVVAMMLIIIIVITFDISEKLDDFLGGHAPLSAVAFQYYLNFIPGFVNLYSPLFIFISVIFFTSKMAGNTEIIAILGSGISYRRMLRPYLVGSVTVALVVLLLGNFVIPVSNQRVIDFENTYIYSHRASYYTNIHFQVRPGVQVYADSYNGDELRVEAFHQDSYDSALCLTNRITADHITYDTAATQWHCAGLMLHTIGDASEQVVTAEDTLMALDVVPGDFNTAAVDMETMNSIDLYHYIQDQKMRGSSEVVASKIELYQRLLNPLAILVMTFIGVGVSSRKSRGGIGIHLAIGISLAFAFIVFMKISTVFAVFGTLNPFLAVLLPQAMFGIIAVYVIRTAPK